MNLFNLKKKRIIITGGAGFIGRQFVEIIFLYNGIPILLDKNKSSLDEFTKYFKKKYKQELDVYKVDITDEKKLKKVKDQIILKYKSIDSLINNAAINPKIENGKENFSRLENFSKLQWQSEIDVSLTGSFLCSKIFGKEISNNINGGVIINVSSDLGLIAPNQEIYKMKKVLESNQPVKPVSYSVCKFGIIGLTKYLSTYWAHRNVRCNAICPGGVENNQDKEFIKKLEKKIPLGRMAKKNEYLSTIIWMLSDFTSYMNGAVIAVDGGRTSW